MVVEKYVNRLQLQIHEILRKYFDINASISTSTSTSSSSTRTSTEPLPVVLASVEKTPVYFKSAVSRACWGPGELRSEVVVPKPS
jgi:hypothetical protein